MITIQGRPLTIVFHSFNGKQTSTAEHVLANVLTVYLVTWLKSKASQFKARFRQV